MVALDTFRVLLDVAILVIFVRTFGWMALIAPRAWWRGWAAENRRDMRNPYKYGTIDHKAWKEGFDVSKEVDPGQ